MKTLTHFWDRVVSNIHFLSTQYFKPKFRQQLFIAAVLVPISWVAITTGRQVETPITAATSLRVGITAAKDSETSRQTTRQVAFNAAKKIDWHAPSESRPYPDLTQHPNLSLVVSLKKQRVFVKDGTKTLYTMYASTGIDNSTPRGHFKIQSERGYDFFNPEEQMGAHYYTSFYLHGTYLFHTVPTDINDQYIEAEAAKLGREPGSHGCVRLSIPDAKWIFKTVPTGTPVVIE
ncbi:D-alanyl-D-alanine carboxypeptidase [Lacticaseibacillus chiayiensis]|uniref:D-alanyl-D-alanine carboxypeptidase n=1 Tax=Lacticaseibacillus chiayiensis TaxID=2100821 RepID=A0A4Q1THM1_9LACO|nr:L,D-transpeptidase [Lacticaseibacillus chiayiensis]QVI34391.1 L,D-transpeptidase [Lacticaseibacillus chiayiensis]RXT17794.1 D-alanyl-D-alanine carboxypeptidase [Lacticaseibacillus chiayiensis]RXT58737.1 D-alanyl-D-alanine carboxypeptidase [Lacticaseibacillus chiayiensis]UYN56126.1 L,D-transpeptidase [Lacticaseibacillus chiayiensis]